MSAGCRDSLPDKAQIITTDEALSAFCARCARAPYVTVDTEFMREATYWPILCLVQVAAGGAPEPGETEQQMSAAIDPIQNPSLSLQPLFDLFANPSVIKVFHAARQDLEIFHHLSGRLPSPLVDTQVVAMACGFGDSVGYENLLRSLTGARVDKGTRFTDWSHRPLNKRQIDYALADVVYLRPAYEKLMAKLEEQGREGWIEDGMQSLLDERIYSPDPRETYKRIKTRNAKPRTLAILRELAAWREIEARNRNQPRNRILRDEMLLEIAHQRPENVADLSRTRGLGKKLAAGKGGAAILAAVKTGNDLPIDQCPKPQERSKLPGGTEATVDLLKVMLKRKCEEHSVAQKLLASIDDLEQIAAYGDKAEVSALSGWRRELFGEDALRLWRGECALGVKSCRIVVYPVSPET